MATANVRNALRIPGRLCHTPTDLSTVFPHGGTALGLVRNEEFRIAYGSFPIMDETFGGATPVEAVYTGEGAVYSAVLRGFDNDAIAAIFPNSAAGTVTQDRVIRYKPGVSGQNRPGYLLSAKAVKLCFSPDDLDHAPMVLLYKAIPAVDVAAALNLTLSSEVGVAVVFYCVPDATGRVYEVGPRKDLAL